MTAAPGSTALADWRCLDVSLTCRGRVPPRAHPRLLARLRGRLGQCLAGRIPPDWFAALFPEQGNTPPPFVLRLDGTATAPVLVVRLLGRAATLAEPVAEALVAALRDGLIVPGGLGPLLPAGPPPVACRPTLHCPDAPDALTLRFLTPVCLEPEAGFSAESFLAAAARRVRAMAAWQDAAMAPPEPPPYQVSGTVTLTPTVWMRMAHRQAGRRVPMAGYEGAVSLVGALSGLMPLLALAELCHVGRHAAFGMGRFEMVGSGVGD